MQREMENRCQSLKTIPRVKNTEAKQPQLVDPLLLPNPPTRQATGPQPAAPIRQTRNQPARPCLHSHCRSRHRRAPRPHGRSRRRHAPRLPAPHRVWPPLARTDVESRCAVPRRQPARPCFHPRRHPQLVWVLLRNSVPGAIRGRTIGDLGRRSRCRNVHHRRATGPLPQPTRPSWIVEPHSSTGDQVRCRRRRQPPRSRSRVLGLGIGLGKGVRNAESGTANRKTRRASAVAAYPFAWHEGQKWQYENTTAHVRLNSGSMTASP